MRARQISPLKPLLSMCESILSSGILLDRPYYGGKQDAQAVTL